MSRFLHPATQEKFTNVGAMVLDRLRRVGESVVAIAGMATSSSIPMNDDFQSVSEMYHDEPLNRLSTSSQSTDPAVEPAASQTAPTAAPAQATEGEEERKRHAAHMLNEHRIKVRDFAYESKLPPVPKPRRIAQGGRRPLRRARDECFGEGEDEICLPEPKRRKLERKVTEPIPSSQNMPPSQKPGFGDLDAIHETSFSLGNGDDEEEMRRRGLRQCSPDQPGVVFLSWPAGFESQGPRPEGWIDTPPITPNGSYVPLPQTGAVSRPASLMDIDAVDITQEPPSLEADHMEETEQNQVVSPLPVVVHSSTATSLFSSLTSLSSNPSTPHLSRSRSYYRRASLRDISVSYNARPPSPPSPVPTPRYLLRNKPTKQGSSPVPRAGSRRLSGSRPSAAPSSHPSRKTRSSAAKRATGGVKAVAPKPVRRSPRNSVARTSRR